MQKVISVNINASNFDTEVGHSEFELTTLNKYLAEGYQVVDKFSTVPLASAFYINITFVIQKDTD